MALIQLIIIAILSVQLTNSRSLVDITTTVEPREEIATDPITETTEAPYTSTTLASDTITLDISRYANTTAILDRNY